MKHGRGQTIIGNLIGVATLGVRTRTGAVSGRSEPDQTEVIHAMSVFPSLPSINDPDVDLSPDQAPLVQPPTMAADGSPALRPGDPDPASADDGAPIFSTDPLG